MIVDSFGFKALRAAKNIHFYSIFFENKKEQKKL